MDFIIIPYTRDRIPDVVRFEEQLRQEEDVWGWDIERDLPPPGGGPL